MLLEKSLLSQWNSELYKFIFSKHFHNKYNITDKITENNQESVYKCEDISRNNRVCCVKSISKKTAFYSEETSEDLQEQLSTLKRLDHKNVLGVHEVFDSDTSIKIVTDYYEGGRLSERIKKQAFSQNEVKLILKQILEGVEYLHNQGIMHRNLKPDNIFFKSSNSLDIVIVDFQIAQSVSRKFRYYRCGTPGYVAPEILNIDENSNQKKEYSVLCDVYSIGALFYEL